jgi:glutathione S-transferase
MKLLIGNKTYSSWSHRPWLVLKHFNIPFEEVLIEFDSFSETENFKQRVKKVNPAGKVPTLVDDNGFAVWDSLAICEYLHDKYPSKNLWPKDRLVSF